MDLFSNVIEMMNKYKAGEEDACTPRNKKLANIKPEALNHIAHPGSNFFGCAYCREICAKLTSHILSPSACNSLVRLAHSVAQWLRIHAARS